MSKKVLDYSLYLITDRNFLGERSMKKVLSEAIEAGVTFVQVREKGVSTRKFYEIALEVKEITDYYKIPMVINDRMDIAQAVEADGVHLGQKDMSLAIARRILGEDKIIGISTNNLEEAVEAEIGGADYIGIGPVFFTGSKKDLNEIMGTEGLLKVCSGIKIPKVAIGGIHKGNVKEIMQTGTEGIAVISAILGQQNIKEAVKNLLEMPK